jgi:hypothetical protein
MAKHDKKLPSEMWSVQINWQCIPAIDYVSVKKWQYVNEKNSHISSASVPEKNQC